MAEHQDLLTAALIKAKKKFKPLTKSGHNKHRDYHYSTLKDLANATDGPLLDEGLTIMHYPFVGEGRVVGVKTELEHISGQKRSTSLALTPAGTDPQSAGSCISYAKRYNKEALLDIAGEDDDGVAASEDDSKPSVLISAGYSSTPHVVKSGNKSGDFVVTFGTKFPGKRLSEISPPELANYVNFLKKPSKDGRPNSASALAFIAAAESYMASFKADVSDELPPPMDIDIPF